MSDSEVVDGAGRGMPAPSQPPPKAVPPASSVGSGDRVSTAGTLACPASDWKRTTSGLLPARGQHQGFMPKALKIAISSVLVKLAPSASGSLSARIRPQAQGENPAPGSGNKTVSSSTPGDLRFRCQGVGLRPARRADILWPARALLGHYTLNPNALEPGL